MTYRTYLPLLALSLALTAGSQTPAPREISPEQKAYQDASKIADPEKKIAALEKLRQDFPKSNYSEIAASSILTTLVKSMPDQKDRIRKTADGIYKAAVVRDKNASRDAVIVTTRNRENEAAHIATEYLTAGILLKDAQSWARRSIEPMRQGVWLSEQRETYAKRKQAIPSQEELVKRFNESRASRIGTLGRIEYKLGNEAAAKKLLEESYAVSSSNIAVAGALGEMAAKSGDDAKALDYLVPVQLSGRAPDASKTAFETLYKKSHNGSLEGVQALLDTEYIKRFPNPVHPDAYKASENRSGRMVLGEVFTGAGCPPCVAADLAFDAALGRYERKDLAVVMYHEHIPRPDPMTTADTTARAKFYAVRGVPTYVVDGKDTIGGGSREMTKGIYDKLIKELESELEIPAAARLRLDASVNGGTVRATASASQAQSASKDLRVQILLVEKELRYTGENGVRFHPMVVRAFGGDKAEGYKLEGESGEFSASFDLDTVSKAIKDHLDDYESKGHRSESFKFSEKKYEIDRGNLAVVAFVQDVKTKKVLQAAWADLGATRAHPTTEAQ